MRRLMVSMAVILMAGLLAGPVFAAAAPDAAAPAAGAIPTLTLKPGENRVEPPGGRPYLIWVPTDYTPDRAWPVIINMHGTGGAPSFGALKDLFGGKTFIIVGHEYSFRSQAEENHKTEAENIKRVVATLAANLKIDPKQLFLGGFSQGGWWTTMMAEYTMDMWAGLFPMGSGEHASDMGKHDPLNGKPIFIIAGENDAQFLPLAKKAAEYYKGRGADVSTDWVAGVGHSDSVAKNEKLKSWFLDHGPLKTIKADLATAKNIQKAGRLGEAYLAFARIGGMGSTAECAEAATAAKSISADAETALAAAKTAADAKNYADAVKGYSGVATTYIGSPFAEKAREALRALDSDPTVGPLLAQAKMDAEASTLEAQAKAAEDAKDVAKAIKLYEQYIATYPKATRFAEVKTHLEAMKNDKALAETARDKAAERECRVWLQMATNFLAADDPEKAREYFQKILTTYPGTTWAAKAKEQVDKLPKRAAS
jgi:predicted esterase/outer membrane protein assembly factor BamD (BamD/ComL family)